MRRSSLALNAMAALVAVAVAVAGPGDRPPERAGFMLADATGALALSSSQPDAAILRGDAMRPGQAVTGTVTIGARGADVAALALAATSADTAPGTGGGRLSEHLQLAVDDVTEAAAPVRVYAGTLSGLGQVALGRLAAGEARTFAFAARMPATAGNELQGASMSADFIWSAHVVASPPTSAPDPVPPAAQPSAPGGAVLGTQRCRVRRRATVRLRTGGGVRIRTVRVTVNRRRAQRVERVRRKVVVRGLARRVNRVKVVVRLSDGRRLVVKRTLRPCRG